LVCSEVIFSLTMVDIAIHLFSQFITEIISIADQVISYFLQGYDVHVIDVKKVCKVTKV